MVRRTPSLLMFLVLLPALASLQAVAERKPLAVEMIDGDPMYTHLPPGAIPALTRPEFVSAAEAGSFMAPDEPVLGVVHHGIAKAYSTWQLESHEVVNDFFGDAPLAVTW